MARRVRPAGVAALLAAAWLAAGARGAGEAPPAGPPDVLTPVPSVAEGRFLLPSERGTFAVPCLSTHPLDRRNRQITRAVVVIHGVTRNVQGYFRVLTRLARSVPPADERTLIVAPQFLIEEDLNAHHPGASVLFWLPGAWKAGYRSLSTTEHPRAVAFSSFAVVDRMLRALADRRRFPRLRGVVVAGHSAGGQFVNRFAAGSRTENTVLRPLGIRVRYIVANPSSYLYFSEERRVPGSMDRFAVPAREVRAGAPRFNRYPLGMAHLNDYMQRVGAARIRRQYAARDVIYLVGEQDNDPEAPYLDTRPEALLQGAHRRERAEVYSHYLRHVFGRDISRRHRFFLIPAVGHSGAGVFGSPTGMRYLFGVGGR